MKSTAGNPQPPLTAARQVNSKTVKTNINALRQALQFMLQFVKRLAASPVLIAYVCMTIVSLLCCVYIAWMTNIYYFAQQSSGALPTRLSEDVLQQIGTIRDRRLPEISGIACSVRYKNSFWVHNDSGNPAELFLINAAGSVLASVKLDGAVNRDWEDICTFQFEDTAFICVGDVGDNSGQHKSYRMYVVEEPQLDLEKTSARNGSAIEIVVADCYKIDFQYEDGPKNCEAFAWDSASGGFLLAEKGFDGERKTKPGIYCLTVTNGFADRTPLVARRVADCKLKNTTAMSISGNGNRLVLASYAVAAVWDRDPSGDWTHTLKRRDPTMLPMPLQRQGEAIALDHSGQMAITTSEFVQQPIWQIQVDAAIQARPGRTKTR